MIQGGNSNFLVEKEVGLLISEANLVQMWVTEHTAILERGWDLSHRS